MKLKFAAVAMGMAAVTGCQTTNMQNMIWVRTDGQRGTGNPALSRQFELDRTVCVGEVQKSAVGAPLIYYQGLGGAISAAMIQDQNTRALIDIMKGCMATKGYVLVPQSEAANVAATYRKK